MLKSAIDHLVVTASTREAGDAHLAGLLGVLPQKGGEHPSMGTHNSLLRLGDTVYLEVIAINPHAPAPSRARMFALDSLAATAQPRLATWVVRTNDIQAAAERSPVPLGKIEAMTRDTLAWRLTVPADGGMPWEGAAPSLIQWPSAAHPAAMLPDMGCALESLEIRHPQAQLLGAFLREIGFEGPLALSNSALGRSGLSARIRTAKGAFVLGEL